MDYNKDYYKILNLDKSASKESIKKSYRELSKKHHPDRGGDDTTFKEIGEAYEILSDERKRKDYDVKSPYGANYGQGGFKGTGSIFEEFGFSMDDIFDQFFNTGRSQYDDPFSRKSGFEENLNIEKQIDISLEQIYNNEKIEIEYKRNVICSSCDGTGLEEGDNSDECVYCQGRGFTAKNGVRMKCKYCNGSGKVHLDHCKKCNGEKVYEKTEKIPIENPSQLNEEPQKIIQRGLGHFSKYFQGKRGDLILILNPLKHKNYTRKGVHLHRELNIDVKTAVLGGEIEFTHLDNKTYSFEVPPESDNGDKYKLQGKGLYFSSQSVRGNLVFHINVKIDYENMSDEDKEKIKEINI